MPRFSGFVSSVIARLVLCSAIAALPRGVGADDALPFLHPLFTDHMVLQRDVSAPVWGWTTPGSRVEVTVDRRSAAAVAGADGRWLVRLPPLPAGGPHEISIDGPQKAVVRDVLIGDVWICSGQSNMQWDVRNSNDADLELRGADFPRIRLYSVPRRPSTAPERLVDARWELCRPEQVAGFSAVAYFFGRELHRASDVPIGLIHSSWGGTIAEAWVSGESLETLGDFRDQVKSLRAIAAAADGGASSIRAAELAWWRSNDPGSKEAAEWSGEDVDLQTWRSMDLPARWEGAGLPGFDGIVWFRRELEIPADWAGHDLTLELGPIDDIDTSYFAGKEVGSLDDWSRPRRYRIPGPSVRAGKQAIAVRVLDTGGGGGMYGEAGQYSIGRADGVGERRSLAGAWRFRDSARWSGLPPYPRRTSNNPNVESVLYNGMIAPLVPYALRGAIWYQGESNAGRPRQYRALLPTLIRDWRNRFEVGEFPFLIVQLANFMKRDAVPVESQWAELREAQWLTARNDLNAGLAVAIDIGEANDIHPRNKQDVGQRLALAARAIALGEDVVYSGPEYAGHSIEKGRVRLRYRHVGSGLVAHGEALKGFAIAGEDGKYVWADAKIEGEEVVLSAADVERPVAVRYAWSNNPEATLFNREGLPAVPFRTDTDGITRTGGL
jgi:sialate O-acetylesterase